MTMFRSAFFVFLSCATVASAQMAVHAVTGMVKAVGPHSISVATDSDTTSRFSIPSSSQSLAFPEDLRSGATDAGKFQKTGDYVVVYYYGFDDQRTVVAVKDLGPGPFTKVEGTVTGFDKHSRALTLKDSTGKEITLACSDSLVIDMDNGVQSGRKFAPHKGDQVRVTYGAGATPTIAFLHEAL
jgi:hypothetical protein